MVQNKVNREIPEEFAAKYDVYAGETANIKQYKDHQEQLIQLNPEIQN